MIIPTAVGLSVENLAVGTATMRWLAPGKLAARTRARIAVGSVAPRGPGLGAALPIKGSSAKATKLRASTVYSVSLFTKVGAVWSPPLTTTFQTPDAGGTNSYAALPDTVVLGRSDTYAVKDVGGAVSVAFAAGGRVPEIGEAVVIPASDPVTGGYLGKVTAISDNGRSTTLAPAGLIDAFSSLHIDSALSAAPRSAASAARPEVAMADRETVGGCMTGAGILSGISVNDTKINTDGHVDLDFEARLVTLGWRESAKAAALGPAYLAARSTRVEEFDFTASYSMSASTKLYTAVEGSFGCSVGINIPIGDFAGPLPIVVDAHGEITAKVAGSLKTELQFGLNSGFETRMRLKYPQYVTQITKSDFEATLKEKKNSTPATPASASIRGSGTFTVDLSGGVKIGIGKEILRTGGSVYLDSTLTPIEYALEFSRRSQAGQAVNCLEQKLGGKVTERIGAEAMLLGKWGHDWSVSRSVDWTYDGWGTTTPQGCTSLPTATETGGDDPADTTAPAAFDLLTPANGASVAPGSLFDWEASTDAGGVKSYRVFIDGELEAIVPGNVTSYRPFFGSGAAICAVNFDPMTSAGCLTGPTFTNGEVAGGATTPAATPSDDWDVAARSGYSASGGAIGLGDASVSPATSPSAGFDGDRAWTAVEYGASVPAAGANLRFDHRYRTAPGDGGTIEIKVDAAGDGISNDSWQSTCARDARAIYGVTLDCDQSIVEVGGGYDAVLGGDASSHPLAKRNAFSGDPGEVTRTTIDLSAFAGKDIRVRFRAGTDSCYSGMPAAQAEFCDAAPKRIAWRIDNIALTETAPPGAHTWYVVARDAAGNVRASRQTWTVNVM